MWEGEPFTDEVVSERRFVPEVPNFEGSLRQVRAWLMETVSGNDVKLLGDHDALT